MSILDILSLAARADVPSLLVTVIGVEGSSYRKPGSMMWLDGLGTSAGMISGGCLEDDLKAWSSEFFSKEILFDIRIYDMHATDDLGWGKGMGCNGTITLLIEKVTPDYQRFLFDCLHFLQSEPVLLQRKWHKDCLYRTLFKVTESIGVLRDTPLRLFEKIHQVETLPNETSFSQLIWPAPRLLIFGAGDDVIPLVSFAAECHFNVTIVDPREAYCNHDRFPLAKACIPSSYKEFVVQHSWSPYDAVVIMTHQFTVDRDLIHHLLKKSIFYLGVLGNKKRTLGLLDGTSWPYHLHSPAGLSISAEGPEEIAASIVAELIQCIRHQKE